MAGLGDEIVKGLQDFATLVESGKPLDSECRVTQFTIENGQIVAKRSEVKKKDDRKA